MYVSTLPMPPAHPDHSSPICYHLSTSTLPSCLEWTPRSLSQRHAFTCHASYIVHHSLQHGAAHNSSVALAHLALHVTTLRLKSSSLHARSTPRLQHGSSSSGNLDDVLQMIGSCDIEVPDAFPSKMDADIHQQLGEAGRGMWLPLGWHVITKLIGGESRQPGHWLRWRGRLSKILSVSV